MACLPTANSSALTMAPAQMARSVGGASGSQRSSAAKATVSTSVVMTTSNTPNTASAAPNQRDRSALSAASTALSSSAAMARKPKPSTSAKAISRARTKAPRAEGCGATWPMRLSARRSCAKTPLAPSNSVATPSRPAQRPASGRSPADSIMVWMARADSSPTRSRICPTICPRAASAPNT